MLFDFPNDSPDFERKQKQLQLARKHAQEWQELFIGEISHRQDLERKHLAEISRFFLVASFKEQAAMLTRQVREIAGLKQGQKLVRDALSTRHTQQKAVLSGNE
jgi:hypothetical protein